MLSILSLLISTLGPSLPLLIKYFVKRQEIKRDIELKKLEIDARLKGLELEGDIANITATMREKQSLYDHDSKLDGGRFINALRASIRPVLTIAIFGLWVFVKFVVLYQLVYITNIEWSTAIKLVWDDFSNILIASIIGFWFGGRIIDKHWNK